MKLVSDIRKADDKYEFQIEGSETWWKLKDSKAAKRQLKACMASFGIVSEKEYWESYVRISFGNEPLSERQLDGSISIAYFEREWGR